MNTCLKGTQESIVSRCSLADDVSAEEKSHDADLMNVLIIAYIDLYTTSISSPFCMSLKALIRRIFLAGHPSS